MEWQRVCMLYYACCKEIKRIFQRVREIIDENQKKNRAQNAALRNSSLDRKRG